MRFFVFFMTCLYLWSPVSIMATTAEEKGLEIAIEVDKRDEGFQDSTVNMIMVLKNKYGEKSVRRVNIKTLEGKGDGDKSLSFFIEPRDIKGTAFLTHSHQVGDDDQWLYLPALKRVKRISSRNKSGSFMGSEFSYEDIANQVVEKYKYKWIYDETLEGMECYVLDRFPVDLKHSGYTRQRLWIDKKEYRILKIEYFDRKKSLLKTLSMSDYELNNNRYWRALKMSMVNHQNGKSTELFYKNYQFQNGLRESDFTKIKLKSTMK